MTDTARAVFISAGEESGDLHGASLVRAMRARRPGLVFRGLGGKKMRDAGVETLHDIAGLGGIGLAGILGGFFHHWRIYRDLAASLRRERYSAAILIHYPMFNLLLAQVCRRENIPVYFFISPQVWAWRKGRIKKIRRTVDTMYVILPFEEKLYREAGVDVEYVGHPFLDVAKPTLEREAAAREFGLKPGVKTVGLLPGSRKSEIDRLLRPMLEGARRIRDELGDCRFLLPVADSIPPEYIREHLRDAPVDVTPVFGKTYDVMNVSDFLICCSGSATLEAGLLGCPMVIAYRLNPVTFFLGRQLVDFRYFGLVNIVAGREVARELLQGEVTPEHIAREALAVLQHPERERELRAQLARLRESLGRPGVVARLAESLLARMDSAARAPR